jgi:hypothetical protein
MSAFMSPRWHLGFLTILLVAGCASTPEPRPSAPPMTREAYLEWRAEKLLRAEPKLGTFSEAVTTPEGDWPGHLQGRTIVFRALWLKTREDSEDRTNPINGRSVVVVELGNPDRSDQDTRLCLDADDYAEDKFRYDNLAARSGEWRGTPVNVTAFMTGVSEDPGFEPWIGRILAVEPSPTPD